MQWILPWTAEGRWTTRMESMQAQVQKGTNLFEKPWPLHVEVSVMHAASLLFTKKNTAIGVLLRCFRLRVLSKYGTRLIVMNLWHVQWLQSWKLEVIFSSYIKPNEIHKNSTRQNLSLELTHIFQREATHLNLAHQVRGFTHDHGGSTPFLHGKTVENILVMKTTCIWADAEGRKEMLWPGKTFAFWWLDRSDLCRTL